MCMYLCMYACMYVFLYVCIYTYVCMFVYIYTYVFICMYGCIYYICMNLCNYTISNGSHRYIHNMGAYGSLVSIKVDKSLLSEQAVLHLQGVCSKIAQHVVAVSPSEGKTSDILKNLSNAPFLFEPTVTVSALVKREATKLNVSASIVGFVRWIRGNVDASQSVPPPLAAIKLV